MECIALGHSLSESPTFEDVEKKWKKETRSNSEMKQDIDRHPILISTEPDKIHFDFRTTTRFGWMAMG